MSAPVSRAMPETFRVKLTASRDITPRVKLLEFERLEKSFHFLSGQWVSLVLPMNDEKGRPVRRSYSIASVPADSARFELVVTRVDGGVGSSYLHDAPVGTEFECKGPQGTFVRTADHAGPALFVCTGTGVAPFRGMIHDALTAGEQHPLRLLFGVRSSKDLIFADELFGLEKTYPQLKVHVSMSQPEPGWAGMTGYVQTHVEPLWKELSVGGALPHAYICGVKKMLLATRDVLKTHLGVERPRIHVESYD